MDSGVKSDDGHASAQAFLEDIREQVNKMLTELYTQTMNTSEAMGVLIGSAVGLLVNVAMIEEGIREKVIHQEYTDFVTNNTTKAIDNIYGDLDKFIMNYK